MTEHSIIRAEFLLSLYANTIQQIEDSVVGISHELSLQPVIEGVNCLNWQVGHVVVARTNFLIYLQVPSIWSWDKIKRYMPGSPPITEDEQAVPLAQLLDDLARTQAQLQEALGRADTNKLSAAKDNRSVAEQLAFYAAHEAGHASQIELICRILKSNNNL